MRKKLDIALAVIFLIVGILASYNTFALHNYIRETLPRDQAQERCNTETIHVLTQWLEVRKLRDASMDQRDEDAITALDHQLTTGRADPEQLAAWRDSVVHDRQVRATADAQSPPLPKC